MVNQKLKEVYSDGVFTALSELAHFFEDRDTVAYAYSTKGDEFNIKAPIAILFDNRSIKEKASYAVSDCYDKYAGHLSPEDNERLCGLTCSYAKELWVDYLDEKEPMLELWVK